MQPAFAVSRAAACLRQGALGSLRGLRLSSAPLPQVPDSQLLGEGTGRARRVPLPDLSPSLGWRVLEEDVGGDLSGTDSDRLRA